MVDAMSTSSFV